MLETIEINPGLREAVEANDGYCPCVIEQSEDTLCPCKEFRERTEPCECHCGRYAKISVEERTKIKTPFAKVIVGNTAEKPCYSIMYYDTKDKQFHIGWGSFNLSFVFKWLEEEFEIVEGDLPALEEG